MMSLLTCVATADPQPGPFSILQHEIPGPVSELNF